MIKLNNVSRLYPARAEVSEVIRALDNVSLHVEPGEWLAIMGPSGSGKSTLVNLIGCLDRPTSGEIWLEGENVANISNADLNRVRAEKVGFIFQQYHLVPYLTAVENVMLAQYFHSLADENEAAEALTRVGLGDRLLYLPSQLSGGEQQRVCVARALINQPNLILADEPTGNLDEMNEAIVMSLFTELHRAGHTVVVVTHDPEIGRMAERRIELHHGHLSEVSVFPKVEEELIDNLLKEVWHAREDTGAQAFESEKFAPFVENRATFQLMAAEELVRLAEGRLAFTPAGESRAAK